MSLAAGHLQQEEMKGNYDGSLTNRWNFEDDFNCKVANVSALSGTYPTSSDKGDTIEYTTNFVYKEIPDEYQFYPEGTKFIKSKTMIWNKATSGYTDASGKPITPIINPCNIWLKISECINKACL